MKCPRCQQDNPSHAMFCLACGAPVNEAPSQARRYAELKDEIQRLRRSLSVALEQQTATAEILKVIARSPTDVQPVFDTIARNAARLCGGVYSTLYRVEGASIHFVGHHNFTPDQLDTWRRTFPRPVEGTGVPVQRVVRTGTVYRIGDPEAQDDTDTDALTRAGQQARGLQSLLIVPMFRQHEVIGAIGVTHRERNAFTDAHVELLKTFADQAVIAIENVRLFKELQSSNCELTTALDTQTATSDILRVISQSQTDVQPVFDAIVAGAVRLLRAYSGAMTRVVAGDQIELATFTSIAEAGDAAMRAVFPQSLQSAEPHAQAVRQRVPLNISDTRSDARLPEATRAYTLARGYRSWVLVPLLRHDEALGVIGVTRREPGGFTDDEIALLQTFADQAVIAIENVRLFKELAARNRDLTESLDWQTATAEILRVISQAQSDVRPVFEAIADSAMRLLGAWATAVTRYDGEQVSLAAARGGLPGSADAARDRLQLPHRPTLPPEQPVLTKRVHHVVDVETDPTCSSEFRRHAVERGFRSFVSVPMLRGNDPLGIITVSRAQPGEFSTAEIGLLQTFADQAVIAVENVRLLTELQARTTDLSRSVGQLTALGEVGQAVSSSLDLDTVLTTIVARAVQISGLDGGVIFEYDEAAEEFTQRAATDSAGALAEARRTARVSKGEGVVGRTAVTLGPVQVPDITAGGAYEGRLRGPLIEAGVRAVLAVPMLHERRLIGCLAVTRNVPGDFPTGTIELLRTLATQSTLALQNARLFWQLADKSRQLEAASQHKSEFLANMSHELRTPLNAVIGFSEVLGERMFGELNDKQAEYVQDINASGTHLLSLINDILDLSKIEAGRMELELADFHLPQAIENALVLVRERALRRGLTLEQSTDPRLGEIRGDERKIKQVLLNLLSNAIKFTPEGGRIDVRAVLNETLVKVSVADTGVGIAPEDLETVFEEFRQVGTAEKKAEGTGLGLALARKFIELHGGRIWVQSQVGVGSTFTFTVPVHRGN